jgi:predicted acyl esterase
VEVTVRGGTILRTNIFRPERDGSYLVIMSVQP